MRTLTIETSSSLVQSLFFLIDFVPWEEFKVRLCVLLVCLHMCTAWCVCFVNSVELLRLAGRKEKENLKRPACRTGSSQVHFYPAALSLQASSTEGQAVDPHPPPVGTPLVSVSSVLCCVAPP